MERGSRGPSVAKLKVCPITRQEAASLVSKHHYLGDKPFRCSHAYGLFDGEIVGAIVFHGLSAPETAVGAFGLPRNEQHGLWEIGRLVLRPDYNGGNHGTRLLWGALRLLREAEEVRAIITYADSSLHSGGIYRAGNFKYYGLTASKKDFFVDGHIQERGKTKGVAGEWRDRSRKHRYLYVFDKTLEARWTA